MVILPAQLASKRKKRTVLSGYFSFHNIIMGWKKLYKLICPTWLWVEGGSYGNRQTIRYVWFQGSLRLVVLWFLVKGLLTKTWPLTGPKKKNVFADLKDPTEKSFGKNGKNPKRPFLRKTLSYVNDILFLLFHGIRATNISHSWFQIEHKLDCKCPGYQHPVTMNNCGHTMISLESCCFFLTLNDQPALV